MTIEPKHLRVYDRTTEMVYLDGELFDKIKAGDSTWTIDNGDKIMITLEKADENIWKTILIGDQEIDTSKVDNSKHIHEFDVETQAALRKILYEQNRKNNGLPSTEEEEQLEMMKKAWNQPGSPFEGQPFDPSRFNMPGGQSLERENKGN